MKILWSFYELYKITKDTQTKKDFIERVISRRNHYDKFGDTYPKELQQIIQELGDIVSPKKTYVVGSKDF
jgi:hypothetical protein